jgi:hypothetical protein
MSGGMAGGVRAVLIAPQEFHQPRRRFILKEIVGAIQNMLRFPVSVLLLLSAAPLLLFTALILLDPLPYPLSLLRKLFGIPRQELHQLRAFRARVVFEFGPEGRRRHLPHPPPANRLDNRPGPQAHCFAPP